MLLSVNGRSTGARIGGRQGDQSGDLREELARLQEAFHRLGVRQSEPIQAMCEQVEQAQPECEATARAGTNGRQREPG
jgi:hypothetical protein